MNCLLKLLVAAILFTGLSLSAQVLVQWDASPDDGAGAFSVYGYRVHVGQRPGAYTKVFDVGHQLSFPLYSWPGTKQYVAISCYTAQNVSSPKSVEIEVTFPILWDIPAGPHVIEATHDLNPPVEWTFFRNVTGPARITVPVKEGNRFYRFRPAP